MEKESTGPHVLIIPLPLQGNVNSFLKLAELLAVSGLHVTFVNTHHIHDRLSRCSDIDSRFASFSSRFRFETIPDGFPTDLSRPDCSWTELVESMSVESRPYFKNLVTKLQKGHPPLNAIIGDGILEFVFDVAMEIGIPIIHARAIAACAVWTLFCLPDVIKAGELPIREMDSNITAIPGMEEFLRCRDLPSCCRLENPENPEMKLITSTARLSRQAEGLILNTFEDLEEPILSLIRSHINPKVYTIGPINEHLKMKLSGQELKRDGSSSNALWKVDRSCLEWLDCQPVKSVIYVSFGSIVTITREQLLEFWHGVVKSNKRFLWVRRPGMIEEARSGEDDLQIPDELMDATRQRGKIVGWAPQEEVLAHKAVGGFLTHSGWNSVLESIIAGVPMICWPSFFDQQVNSAFVGAAWKIGLDIKDVCDRVKIERAINDLMGERKEEFLKSASELAEMARTSLTTGGSSSSNLERLVEHIKSLTR